MKQGEGEKTDNKICPNALSALRALCGKRLVFFQ